MAHTHTHFMVNFMNAYNQLKPIEQKNVDSFILDIERFDYNYKGKISFKMFHSDIPFFLNIFKTLCPSITATFKEYNFKNAHLFEEEPVYGFGLAVFKWTPKSFHIPSKYVKLANQYEEFYANKRRRM